jgi:hypothetical protein
MPCLVVIALLGLPRLALLLFWLLTDYTQTAFRTRIWPLIGFFAAPYTTLWYMWSSNVTRHHIEGIWVFFIAAGIFLDFFATSSPKAKWRGHFVVIRRR